MRPSVRNRRLAIVSPRRGLGKQSRRIPSDGGQGVYTPFFNTLTPTRVSRNTPVGQNPTSGNSKPASRACKQSRRIPSDGGQGFYSPFFDTPGYFGLAKNVN